MGSPTYDRAWGAFVRSVTVAHRAVHRMSGGHLQLRLPRGGREVWITARGHRTGEPRCVPLLSVADGDAWIVAGSNGGQERMPAWVHNVRAHADGEIEVGRRSWRVRFEEAHGAERERCYALLAVPWPMYRSYERHSSRPIPVFRCVPLAADRTR